MAHLTPFQRNRVFMMALEHAYKVEIENQVLKDMLGTRDLDNVSKKKLRQQEKEAADRAAREYEAKKNPAPAAKDDKQPLSGDAARPYAKGRAYDPAHYGKKADAQSADVPTEE